MQLISAKGIWEKTRLGRESNPLGIVQEIKIDHRIHAQTRIRHRKWNAKKIWDFKIETDLLIPARKTDLEII